MTEYAVYHSDDGFTLRQSDLGWQWQETGAEGWSEIYATEQAANDAISAEFGFITLSEIQS